MTRLFYAIAACLLFFGNTMISFPAYAADSYVTNFLKVKTEITLPLDDQGQTRSFSVEDLSQGKKIFENSCSNCHVGGTTLPNPPISLSLQVLAKATPSRDTVNRLVEFMRQPMTYDGSEEELLCRQVPESWLNQTQAENLAGFILRAAQIAPGWATEKFDS
jgi:photosystem II cytochrome c550